MSNESRDPRGGLATVEAAVLVYGVVGALDLLKAWSHSPIERFGWVALLVWVAPVVWLRRRTGGGSPGRPAMLGAAVALGFVGAVGSLNVLQHAGLAVAVMSVTPVRGICWVWLVAAVSWTPLLGWALKGLPVAVIPAVRLLVALMGAVALMRRAKEGSR